MKQITLLLMIFSITISCNKEESTNANLPEVITYVVTGITDNSAISGGEIITNGGSEISECGICWSTSVSPTINDNNTVEKGLMAFECNMTNLEANTRYYVRSFATNEIGTAYGNTIVLETNESDNDGSLNIPTVQSTNVTDVTLISAICEGTVTDDAGYIVTDRGFCMSQSPTPTINDTLLTNGLGVGSFTTKLDSLGINTTYYVRAYANNENGTAYGSTMVFTTVTFPFLNPDFKYDFVTDIEDNIYSTIDIGSQTWMTQNLRTTKFNDGSNIEHITNNTIWDNTFTDAYCWPHNNFDVYAETQGALYNWFAVETDKLCPDGWHVPTNNDWNILFDYLIENGYNFDGSTEENKLAKSLSSELSNWDSPSSDEGAPCNTPELNNTSGFSVMTSNFRIYNGDFVSGLLVSFLWSASENDMYTAHTMLIDGASSIVEISSEDKRQGSNVRCVKD
ncbi:MAG: FISUMP domain-containing protein [Bacteroidales bacterium]|jgi:uncharacterized protein (TIGR02145 family)|nr:FISUMP domain-containing protein [Bacteroidales bacterium]